MDVILEDQRETGSSEGGGSATAVRPRKKPGPPRPMQMPPWKVLLHNDNVNDMVYVVATIVELTTLNRHAAVHRMLEAHNTGVALLLVTHREHAELL
ncbi:MAG: ATP-dependent Clp protease adaptor ClpS, partial [Planctomycetota bacterium]